MFGRRKNRTIGEITYAIDHNTGMLDGGALFKTVVMENGKVFEEPNISFNRKKFTARYKVAGTFEIVSLELQDDNSFILDYTVKLDGARAIIKSRFNDMRSATFNVSSVGYKKAHSARLARLTAVISFYGGNPELLSSCVTAFRSYLRNKSKGKLEPKVVIKKEKAEPKKPGRVPSATPTKTQGPNLKGYQLERRESVKRLRDVMCSAKKSLGVSVESRGVPVISTIAIQDYLKTGLMEMSVTRDRVRVAKKILRKHHFETPAQAKAFYPAAVDAVHAATDAISDYMKS